MGHGNTNALYVRASEHSGALGRHGASSGSAAKSAGGDPEAGFKPLTYDNCAISLQPWKHPVCCKDDGTIFDLMNVIPYIKKYGTNPATGHPLNASQLLTLHFHKNEEGKYSDPISYKGFNEHTHIVAIATTGNVYAYETVQQLNIKGKNWHDLLDESTAFKREDIITLQDPYNMEGKDIRQFNHIKEGKVLTAADRGEVDKEELKLSATGSTQSLLKMVRASQGKGEGSQTKVPGGATAKATTIPMPAAEKSLEGQAQQQKQQQHANGKSYLQQLTSTGMMAASFTSSAITPRTVNERTTLSEEEYMFEHISNGTGVGALDSKGKKTKGYVRLTTNFGPLNLQLHVDKAPKTCYNFLTHCKNGYYDNTIFHRNIPGFMIQGGDPTGTGRGGESIWGKPFRDEVDIPGAYKHASRGVLSMANKGAGTNGSQFFLTYRKTPHLDGKHTVFGCLIEGENDTTLDALEQVPTEPATNRPLRSIRILDAAVFEDPFEKFKEKLVNKLKRENMTDEERRAREERKRKREDDRTTWLGTNLDERTKNDIVSLSFAVGGVGKYVGGSTQGATTSAAKQSTAPLQSTGLSSQLPEPAEMKRKTAGGGFGDFSTW
ncbi:hypothetical protein K437DRAFT_240666 [Tilletiaria anomala UBC 951]|uniref:Cyclophilin-like protein n=1 Tax=Tilletiaria anomala (strain ATCC 24038 / CBS 436.72 / UBC 951) TaxID=1037660 RepID=A0A066VFW3_TILAU|nr:uncharacterized protein K437DRAFT_240666 [Tilletiaria anomala UBC 951]KDN37460.1 hypothetical protein K437DRAFT_240666 [Tilletiaria anomala UBC 951]